MMADLPKIGYIALINDKPIAAAFLRRIEPHYGQIDTLVSIPYFGSTAREQAIERIISSLMLEASKLRLKSIISVVSPDKWTLKRASDLVSHL